MSDCALPSGWALRAVGDLATVVTGRTPSTAVSSNFGGDFPFATPVDLQGKSIKYAERTLSASGALTVPKVPRGTTLVSCIGALGKTAFAERDIAFNQQINALIPRVGINERFLFYWAQMLERPMAVDAGLQVVPIVNKSTLSKIELPLPLSEKEQRRIAELLSTLDEQIEQTEALIDKEAVLATGLMQKLIPQGFNFQWVHSEVLASAISSIEGGKSFMCSDTPAPEGTWGVLKVSAIKPNAFVETENKTVENRKLVNPKYEVKHGDLLITRANTPELVGSVCLTVNPRGKLLLCDKTLRLHVRPGLSKEYLWIWLQTPIVRRHVDAHATGTSAGMKNISQGAIFQMPLHLPSPLEQLEIVQPIAAQLAHIDGLRRTRDKLRMLKTGLAADLLLGKKRLVPKH